MSGAAVTADGLGLKGPRGTVFEGVSLDAPADSLISVEGPSGTGRTCLLLALTGRMRTTAGHATVGGHRLPKRMSAVRRIAALGPVPGVTDLEPSLTVAEQLRERALLRSYFTGRRLERRSERRARVEAALADAGLDPAALPKGARTAVRDLERLEYLRLQVALALLNRPRLLAVDDVGLKLSDTDRGAAWALLRDLTRQGVTVLAVCSEPPPASLGVPVHTVRLGPPPTEAADDTDRADGTTRAGGAAARPDPREDREKATPPPGAADPGAADPDAGTDHPGARTTTTAAGTGTHADDTTDTETDTGTDAGTGADTEGDDDALAEARRA